MSDKIDQAEETLDIFVQLVRERDNLRAENERLRAALDEIATESLDEADRCIALEALGDL